MLYGAPLHNQAIVASGRYLYHAENIVVDEIGRMICSHFLAHAHTYSYILLTQSCMHDTATYNIVAINNTVQLKFKSHSTYQPP